MAKNKNVASTNTDIPAQLRRLKREVLPNDRLILFGSQARGDSNENSDWDLLVLLRRPTGSMADRYGKYGFPFLEYGWTLGKHFSVKVYAEDEWEQSKFTLFHKNVEHDGVEIR
jgi:predicted nucleotidyltransferase